MSTSRRLGHTLRAVVLAPGLLLAHPLGAWSAPVVRSADIAISFERAGTCDVVMRLAVTDADRIEHRLDLTGIVVDAPVVEGAETASQLHTVGATRVLVVQPASAAYSLRYRVTLNPARPDRCPLWLPVMPTDGVAKTVAITVALAPGNAAGETMPRLSWSGTRGTAMLGHLPAFVSVSHGPAGTLGWTVSALMDLAAVGVLAVATALFWARRKR